MTRRRGPDGDLYDDGRPLAVQLGFETDKELTGHPYTRSDHANVCGRCGRPMFDAVHVGPPPSSEPADR